MPRFDGTGPMGRGAMTGRGMGYCAIQVSPPAGAGRVVGAAPVSYYPAFAGAPGITPYGFAGPFYPRFGRGFRMGCGRGFGGRGGRRRRW
jgi:hypothetical protein